MLILKRELSKYFIKLFWLSDKYFLYISRIREFCRQEEKKEEKKGQKEKHNFEEFFFFFIFFLFYSLFFILNS